MRAVNIRRPDIVYSVLGCSIAVAYIVSVIGVSLALSVALWLVIGALLFLYVPKKMRYHASLLVLMVLIMAFTPVTTSTEFWVGAPMIIGMLVALSVPFLAQRFIKKEDFMHFRINFRHKPTRREWGYIIFAAVIVTFWLNVFFLTTDAVDHWYMTTPYDKIVTFLAIMAIGVWEEFFFIGAIFGILRQYLSYHWANFLQATLFTTFLWQVGFRGWIVFFLLCYTLYQGMVYYRTRNLTITLIIHALVDLMVFIAALVALQFHPL